MKRAFTLLELIIVVIIIGILISVAIPQYTSVTEKARAAEGIQILGILRGAQIRYNSISGQWYSEDYYNLNLDVSIETAKYFDLNQTYCHSPSWGGVHRIFTGTTRLANTFGPYLLGINEAGEIYCYSNPKTICKKLGFLEP
jgi:prepilin-type N-terminal cleavage/methylation domain-containing protein